MENVKKTSVGSWCSAPNCSNNRRKGYRLFRFPRDEERCRKWVQNCRRNDLIGKPASYLSSNCFLCSVHFEPSQFMNPVNPKCRLISDALPTIFNVPNPPKPLTAKRKLPERKNDASSSTVQTKKKKISESFTNQSTSHDQSPDLSSTNASTSQVSPRKAALKVKVKNLQQKCRRLLQNKSIQSTKPQKNSAKETRLSKKRLLDELKNFLPHSTYSFVATQIRLHGINKKGHRWTSNEKAFFLSVLHASPKAYRILRKVFNLPSVTTLKRAMQSIKIYPGFNENILQALKEKIGSMKDEAKFCVVVFDEMSIKEELTYNSEEDYVEGFEDFGHQRTEYAANHATVFMVRGLVQSWKQAVGYILSSGPVNGNLLRSLVLQCIEKVEEVGLKVKAIVCDQGSNNRKAMSGLGINEDRPYFHYRSKKIFVIYDPPHLLKNIRNNFKNTGYYLEDNKIEWKYVESFFKMDSRNSVRMAPRLTEKHIRLPGFSSLRVKYATQVLSHSVAAGISTMVNLDALPKEADVTAQFVERMDQLFNSFNSSSVRSSQRMRHAISEKSGHADFFHTTLSWLSQLKSQKGRQLPCISGWKISIRSLLGLLEELQECQIRFVFTGRLNQDCIENLFSVIRGKGGHVDNPSPKQFRLCLRQVMVDSVLVQSPSSNCAEDGDRFLLTLNSMERRKLPIQNPIHTPSSSKREQNIDPSWTEYSHNVLAETEDISLQEKNILTYISGYIGRKIRPKVCKGCSEILIGDLCGTSNKIFLTNKQVDDIEAGGLFVPTKKLISIVEQLEKIYRHSEHFLFLHSVRTKLKQQMYPIETSVVCPFGTCKLGTLVVNLFLNIRLHFSLKDNNRRFSALSGRKNRKMLKLQHQ